MSEQRRTYRHGGYIPEYRDSAGYRHRLHDLPFLFCRSFTLRMPPENRSGTIPGTYTVSRSSGCCLPCLPGDRPADAPAFRCGKTGLPRRSQSVPAQCCSICLLSAKPESVPESPASSWLRSLQSGAECPFWQPDAWRTW